jgi:hypothetical protein
MSIIVSPNAASTGFPRVANAVGVVRPLPAQRDLLLDSTVQIAAQLLSGAFPYMVEQVQDTLNQAWDFASGAQLTRRFLGEQSAELIQGFCTQLPSVFQGRLQVVLQKSRDDGVMQWDAEFLELLDDNTDPAQLMQLESARAVQAQVDDALREWHLVLAYVCQLDELPLADNPLHPQVLIDALLHTARQLHLDADAERHFLQAFQADLGAELRRILQALLDHFRVSGYDVRQIRRALQSQARAADTLVQTPPLAGDAVNAWGTTVHGQPGMSLSAGSTVPPAPAAATVVSSEAAASNVSGVLSPEAGASGIPHVVPAPNPALVLQALLGRLKHNAAPSDSQAPQDLPELPPGQTSPALMAAITELQSLGLEGVQGAAFAGTQAGSIRAWREHLAEQSDRTVDKLTIEIVSMMFDHVLRDEQVPTEIKALLSRLQFPVLKAALLDAVFFASGTHPARRLIDRVASASIGWEPYGDENDRYRREVDRLVGEIILRFDQDIGLFEQILAQFEAYLADAGPRENDPIARAKRALEDAERREVLSINLTIQVRKVFERVDMEDWMRQFLLGPWIKVLVAASARDAGTPGFSKAFRQAMHELLWSVQPKSNPEERRRLVHLLPSLTRTLRDGLALIRYPQRDLDEFFQQLMVAQAYAVKPTDRAQTIAELFSQQDLATRLGEMQVAQSIPMAAVPGGMRVSPEAVRQAAADHQVAVRMPPPSEESPSPNPGADRELDTRIAQWKRGNWFRLWDGKAFIKAQLRWISPLRTMFLFSGGTGNEPHVMSPDLVRSYVRREYIQSLDTVSLTDRIASAVLADFDRDPTRVERLTTRLGVG